MKAGQAAMLGGGALALYFLTRKPSDGFKYDIGGAAKGILSAQVALGFHPCGVGWAVQRVGKKEYTVRLWPLEGNDWLPSGLNPIREIPPMPGTEHLYGYVAPGAASYSEELPLKVFGSTVSAGNAVAAAVASLAYEKSGGSDEQYQRCLMAPAVARKGKISATGVTTLKNWLSAGGKDLQA